jgi:hypothetical protein
VCRTTFSTYIFFIQTFSLRFHSSSYILTLEVFPFLLCIMNSTANIYNSHWINFDVNYFGKLKFELIIVFDLVFRCNIPKAKWRFWYSNGNFWREHREWKSWCSFCLLCIEAFFIQRICFLSKRMKPSINFNPFFWFLAPFLKNYWFLTQIWVQNIE